MSHERTCFLIAVVALASVPASAASEDEAPSENEIEELLVSASRIGVVDQRIHVLDEADVDSAGFHPTDLLSLLPGVALSTAGPRGALSQARVRGAEANHLLVMIDGIQVNDPAAGSEFDFGSLDLAAIERVEFLAGPQSAVWGSDAIAGVLHFDTTPRVDGRRLRLGYGSHNTTDADIAFARAADRGYAKAVLGHIASDGTDAARNGVEDDGFANTTVHLGAGRHSGNWNLSVVARATDADAEYDPSPAPRYVPVDGDRTTRSRVTTVGATARFNGADRFVPWLTVGSTRTSREHAADRVVTNATIGRRDVATLSGNLLLDRQRFNLTAEYETERFEQTGQATPFGDPNHRQRAATSSVATEYQIDFGMLSVSASVRGDFNDAYQDALSYRLGATTQTSPRWFVNVGRGVKNPTFVERFGYAPDAFVGNPHLQPETSVGYEFGLTQSWTDGSLTLVVFDASLDDEIDGFAFDPKLGGFTARNIAAQSQRRGAELTLEALWLGARWRGAYVYVDSEGGGVREPRRPRHLANLSVRRPLSASVSIGAGLIQYGNSFDQDFSTYPATPVELDAFRLLRADLEIRPTTRWAIQLLVENALDEDYATVYGYRSPGVSAMVRAVIEL